MPVLLVKTFPVPGIISNHQDSEGKRITYESSRKGRNLVIICVVSLENTLISSCGWLEDRLLELRRRLKLVWTAERQTRTKSRGPR